MPRKPRIEYKGAIYHVMSRGNRGDAIFLNTTDRKIFLQTLEEVCLRTGWVIHAFVLMDNHYHLLLETPEANLVAGMKWLQGTYTQRFNIRHGQSGHLMQGRYKALPIDGSGGEYFSTVGSYIHLNPVRAGLIDPEKKHVSDFRWSSLPLYLIRSDRPSWVCVERLLGSMGLADTTSGLKEFERAMQKRALEVRSSTKPWDADEAWRKIRRGWCFGSEAFRDELIDRLDGVIGVSGKRQSFDGMETHSHDQRAAERIIQQGLRMLNLQEIHLPEMKKSCPEKCVLAWKVRNETCVSNEWIKHRLAMGKATNFSALIKRVDMDEDSLVPLIQKVKNIKISD